MRKTFAILAALATLVACNKVLDENTVTPEESNGEIKVALTIKRTDVFNSPETKATVKNAWADGDVVFVFINGVEPPKYLEMKYNEGSWTSTQKNGLEASDLEKSGTMTAVYFPYGSDATVVDKDGEFVFSGPAYNGVFLQAVQMDYVYDEELQGTLELKVPTLENRSYRYIHFDVTGYNKDHDYNLYQDYVKPLTFGSVSPKGFVTSFGGESGEAVAGYVDAANSILSFSGILNDKAVLREVDYQFSIDDVTASILYTRDAGTRTVANYKYVGLGDLGSKTWTSTKYVYLGIDNARGEKLCWATKNLGATAERGSGCYGNYYAWMKTDGHPGDPTGYADTYSFSKENYSSNTNDGDPAKEELKGLWRLPTAEECTLLTKFAHSEVTPIDGVNFRILTRDVEERSMHLFIPVAGAMMDDELCFNGELAAFWTSSEDGNTAGVFYGDQKDDSTVKYVDKYYGLSVRPVFSVKPSPSGK